MGHSEHHHSSHHDRHRSNEAARKPPSRSSKDRERGERHQSPKERVRDERRRLPKEHERNERRRSPVEREMNERRRTPNGRERDEYRPEKRVKAEPQSPAWESRRIKVEPRSPLPESPPRWKNRRSPPYKRVKREPLDEEDAKPGPSGMRSKGYGLRETEASSMAHYEKKFNGKDTEPVEKEKPNFEPSGKLAEDTNTFKGVVIKYNEPPDAKLPKRYWRLYPFKGDETLPVMHIHRQSAYLIGRDPKIADISVLHPSCSKQHAVLQYRLTSMDLPDGTSIKRVRPYIIDLNSANGTYLNDARIEPQRYVELREQDVLKFGFSSREYVLLRAEEEEKKKRKREPEPEEEEEMK